MSKLRRVDTVISCFLKCDGRDATLYDAGRRAWQQLRSVAGVVLRYDLGLKRWRLIRTTLQLFVSALGVAST